MAQLGQIIIVLKIQYGQRRECIVPELTEALAIGHSKEGEVVQDSLVHGAQSGVRNLHIRPLGVEPIEPAVDASIPNIDGRQRGVAQELSRVDAPSTKYQRLQQREVIVGANQRDASFAGECQISQ